VRVRGLPRKNSEKKRETTGKGLSKTDVEEMRREGEENGARREEKSQTQLNPFLLKK